MGRPAGERGAARRGETRPVRLFLAGDVMTGRGIDQVLPSPGDPGLHEPYLTDARDYVELAESATGPIASPVAFTYPWGDALGELKRWRPEARIVNLETSVTTSRDYWRGKSVHYKMNPANVGCLTAAGLDCCVLANNHVLDWGYAGLDETLRTLQGAAIGWAGAGRRSEEARAPAILGTREGRRVLVIAAGSTSSGIPPAWAATETGAGVFLIDESSEQSVRDIAAAVAAVRRDGDLVVVSLHWGGNWGYHVPAEQQTFAHALIDEAGADLVHGHSSHHAKGIEVYHDKVILYGSGNFLDDYEGIRGYEEYRPALSLMYLAALDEVTGRLRELRLVPMRIERFRLHRAGSEDAAWMRDTLGREGRQFGSGVELNDDNTLTLRWV